MGERVVLQSGEKCHQMTVCTSENVEVGGPSALDYLKTLECSLDEVCD